MQEEVKKRNPYPLKIEGQGELNRQSLFLALFEKKLPKNDHFSFLY